MKFNIKYYKKTLKGLFLMERTEGIEPSLSGRKHDILPLNYARIFLICIYYTIIYFLLQDKYINKNEKN